MTYSDTDIYSVESLEFSKIGWVKILLFIINIARGFILMIILFIFNVIIAIKLKLYMSKKNEKFGYKMEKSNFSKIF